MRSKSIIFVVVTLTILLAVLYVRSRFLVVELSFDIGELQKEKLILERKKNILQIELEVLKTPKRIEKYAVEHLGLKQNALSTSVVLKQGKKVSHD